MPSDDELRNTILQALKESAQACRTLSGYIVEAAGHLRTGRIREGNELLARVLAEFNELVTLLEDVQRCKAFTDHAGSGPIADLVRESAEMAAMLEMALDAQQNQDWVFLADILEYEFSEKLGSWKGLLGGLSDPGGARAHP